MQPSTPWCVAAHMSEILGEFLCFEAPNPSALWFVRCPSPSNVADGPSKGAVCQCLSSLSASRVDLSVVLASSVSSW
eukprot:6472730-Amphidinium_carterae.1